MLAAGPLTEPPRWSEASNIPNECTIFLGGLSTSKGQFTAHLDVPARK
jgi:hypothetical protein